MVGRCDDGKREGGKDVDRVSFCKELWQELSAAVQLD